VSPPRRRGPPAVPGEALANAVPYLQAFGHTVLAWIWLDVAGCALDNGPAAGSPWQTQGRMWVAQNSSSAMSCPKINAWLSVVQSRDHDLCNIPRRSFLMAFFKKYNGTTNARLARMERLIWTLIYGGLLAMVLGYFIDQQEAQDAALF